MRTRRFAVSRRAAIVAGVVALVCAAAIVRLGDGTSGASAPSGSAPVDVSAADRHARDPQIVMDAGGTAIALWVREGAGESVVQSAVRPAGGSWQAPAQLSASGQHASSPHLVVNPRGSAIAVWDRLKDGNYVVQAAVRRAGGAWGAVTDLSAAGRTCVTGPACAPSLGQRVARPLFPRVAIDRGGSAVAIWERFSGHSSRVQTAVRPAGGRWRAAVDVVRFATVRSQDFSVPQIALGARGEAIAIWTRVTRNGAVVQSAPRRAAGRWGPPVDVSARGRYGGAAQVAFDANANGLAVWQLTPRGADRQTALVQSASRTRDGRWSRPVAISAAGAQASTPTLAVGSRGAVAVWSRSSRDGTSIVQGADRAPGRGWRTPIALSSTAPGTYAGEPDVAVDARGNVVAAWVLTLPHPDPDDDGEPPTLVQGAVRPAGATWQPRTLPGADAIRGAVRVAVDPRGELAAIWPRVGPGGYFVARALVP